MTTNAQKKRVADAVLNDIAPYSKKQEILLKTGRSYATLRNESGITAAGRYWAAESGRDVPDVKTQNLQQSVLQAGRSEYLSIDGIRRRLRTWQGSEAGYKYTKLGASYFTMNHTQYLVQIPVFIMGARDGKRPVSYTHLTLPTKRIV